MNDDFTEDDIDEDFQALESTRYAAVGTLIGMGAILSMIIIGLFYPPEISAMSDPRTIAAFTTLARQYTTPITILLLLDTIFIMGYTSLFAGIWLIIRDFSEIMAKVGLGLGLLTALADIVENSLLLILVKGLQTGWTPHPLLFGLVYVINTMIDLLSYLGILVYAIILLLIFRPWNSKFIMACLFVLYLLVGLLSILLPALVIVRSFMFVIGLAVGGTILWREEDIPRDILEKLAQQQKGSKNDFIR